MIGIPFAVFAAAALIIVGVFAAVARSRSATVDYAQVNRLRLLFLVSLSVILLMFLVLTLPQLPYAQSSLLFITVLLLGALLYIWEAGRRCVRAFSL